MRDMVCWEHRVGSSRRITGRGHIAQMLSSSSNQEIRKRKQEEGQALKRLTFYQQIIRPLQISAFPKSISARFFIFLHFANRFSYSKVLAWGRHIPSETMAFSLMSARPLFPASAEYKLLRAWELALSM